jgi:hypothetical protein
VNRIMRHRCRGTHHRIIGTAWGLRPGPDSDSLRCRCFRSQSRCGARTWEHLQSPPRPPPFRAAHDGFRRWLAWPLASRSSAPSALPNAPSDDLSPGEPTGFSTRFCLRERVRHRGAGDQHPTGAAWWATVHPHSWERSPRCGPLHSGSGIRALLRRTERLGEAFGDSPSVSARDNGSNGVRHVPRRRVISAAPSAEPREPSTELPALPIEPHHDQHQQDQDDDDHRDFPGLFHQRASCPMSPRATSAQGDVMDPPPGDSGPSSDHACSPSRRCPHAIPVRSGGNVLDRIAARRLDDVPFRLLPSVKESTLGT